MSSRRPKTRVFLIEDHPATARAVKAFLELKECAVEVAFDVCSALKMESKIRFDVLLCDLNLPDGTGWDLLEQLRQASPVRAIAFSAFDEPEHIARSKKAGFAEYVVKGSGPEALLEAIKRAAEGKGRLLTPAAVNARAQRGRSAPIQSIDPDALAV